ncbi:hypothetical protein Glove_21g357 [Diversispora epigaea]|uniref:Uncharacterized protein n=1 Tax=Diversispora epigaea TaxID=1348612 RepID=A0A397JPQ8_9GLOM|nr:hypothetical protein Glove_21g357 [Diversispora epigaea]
MNNNSVLSPPSCCQQLSSDCLEQIFSHFKNDKKSLYILTRVNRHWCRLVIPLLWSHPFKFCNKDKLSLIIRTYIMCLSNNEKQQLIDEGIKIKFDKFNNNNNNNNNINNNNSNNNNNNNNNNYSLPLFHYPKYLKNFESHLIRLAIENWLRQQLLPPPPPLLPPQQRPSSSPSQQQQGGSRQPSQLVHRQRHKSLAEKIQITYKIICNLIFNSCNYLRGLTYHWKEEFNTIKLLDYTEFSRFHQVIYNLRIFKFDYCCFPTPITRNLLSTISKFNNNIQYLLINMDHYVGSELMKIILQFIKSQKRIKVLSINVCLNLDVDPELLYQSIQLHSNTLTHLKLDAMSEFEQLLKLLVICKNLITLEILGFDPEMIPYLDEFPIIPQINVKNLYCLPIMNRNQKGNSSDIQLFSIIYLLKMSNFNLKSFTYLANCTPNLMNVIKYKCSNITHLTLLLSEEKNILDLCNLLMNLQNLENLSFKISSSDLEISDKFIIQKLATSIPYTLNTLGIYFFMTTECLEILLTNCKSIIRVLTLSCRYYITDEIFEILKKYYEKEKEKGNDDQDHCLKEFRYSLFSEGASFSIEHNENIQKLKSFIPIVDVANPFCTPFYGNFDEFNFDD